MIKICDILDYEQPTKYIVDNDNYNDSYDTPVLTAGQSFILGYTNETNNIFDASKENVIIFDDFTTSVQFVDFRFKVKSSAMKILHAKPNVNIKFCYYLLKTMQYQNPTHKRYWISEFAQKEIELPSLKEQEKIVEKMSKIEIGIDNCKNNIDDLNELIKSKFYEMFGSKINNKKWDTKKLFEIASFHNGKAHEKVVDENGKYILITSKAISSDMKSYRRTNEQLYPLKKNDIVMVMSDLPNGKALAKCMLITENDKYTLNQRICCFDNYSFEPEFLFSLLNRHDYFLSFNDGNGQTNLRKEDILNCEIICPPINEQKLYSNFVKKVMSLIKIQEENLNDLNCLFKTEINKIK